jgi:hypothetical protein
LLLAAAAGILAASLSFAAEVEVLDDPGQPADMSVGETLAYRNWQDARKLAAHAAEKAKKAKEGYGTTQESAAVTAGRHAMHEASAAVNRVRAAKAAMAKAKTLLKKAAEDAHESELGAAAAEKDKKQSMVHLVHDAVKKAALKEEDSLQRLKQQWATAKDAAFQKARAVLNQQQAKATEAGDREVAAASQKMDELAAARPAAVAKAVATKIQSLSNPQKLQKMTSHLLHVLQGYNPKQKTKVEKKRIGESADASKMTHDEKVFEASLQKLKQVQKQTQPQAVGQENHDVLSRSSVAQLVDSEASITEKLNAGR